MLQEGAASGTHTLHECTDLEGLYCFEAAHVCMLPDGLACDGCDLAFASMAPPNGIVEAY